MRYIVLFIHAVTITIYQLFFGDPITVETKFPEYAKPGERFIAEITIEKGSLSGFAKLQVELPPGLSAEESDSKGGTFSLSGQTAKIIWTSVPSAEVLEVKLMVVVSASASGEKVVQGKFSYIDNNVKEQVEFRPITIKLTSEGVATNTEPINTNPPPPDTTQKPFTKPEENTQTVSVARNIIQGKTADIYEVELKVKKDALKGFAKIQEKIPAGFIAVGQKTDGSSFSFSSTDHIAKFIWTSLPSQEEMNVSYKIMPKQGAAPDKQTPVEGEFSYLEGQSSKKYTITPSMLNGEILASGTITPTNTVEPTNTNTVAPTNTVSTEPVTTNTVAAEPVNTNTTVIEPVNTNTTVSEPVNTNTVATNNPVSPPKNANISYVVQVGAFKNGVNADALAKRFNLGSVRTEMHEGFTKCLVGKHDEYKEARDARETVKAKGVSDAFVAAYNAAQRITVQEALMITSQKWYR